ncbi:MAG: L-serine ammonia-lyase, iron-sulfur-dependent, subunit alpha [Eubacteriales bacterium]|nr:L-serine ammonia-lyase, iron-sulfur-dependent, subunit alpha [Eubacteriales bacterium]
MDFKNAAELLSICEENGMKISAVMLRRECDEAECTAEEAVEKMRKALKIMRSSVTKPLEHPRKSMGGLIGGECSKLNRRLQSGQSLCGPLLGRAVTYSMGVLEVNASMGLIVAAPTAGSAGVMPGVMLAMQDEYGFSDGEVIDALFNASAVGYLAMRNATVAGAVGGCQAEIGVASAMAASAAVELMGGTPKQSLNAASTVLMNMLGLVCDPVGGLVEYPCQSRNAAGAANAIIAAEIALSGIEQLIPFDEMLDVMYKVGRRLPMELRETALGGCAAAPSACALCGKGKKKQ